MKTRINLRRFIPISILALLLTLTGIILFTQANSTASDRETSDLESYPGFRFVDWQLDEEAFSNEELAREYLIASCMTKQGWEYKPAPSIVINVKDVEDVPEFEDPNKGYVDALTKEERSSYYVALNGVEDPYDEVDGYDPVKGCMNASLREIPGVYALASTFFDELEELEKQVNNGAKVAEAASFWSDCMANLGYNYKTPYDLHVAVDDPEAETGALAEAQKAMSVNQTTCYSTYLESHRRALIGAQNSFVKEHKTTFEGFKKAHAEETERVAELLNSWAN